MTVVCEPGACLHWRMPTEGEMRWQIWEAIACGAKGVIFYTLWPDRNFERTSPDSPRNAEQEYFSKRADAGPRIDKLLDTGEPGALLHVNSTPTRQMIAMGKCYQEIAGIAPTIRKLRFSNMPAAFASAPLRVQTFRGPHGSLYAVVVNDNTDQAVELPLTILPGIEKVVDVRTAKALPIKSADHGLVFS